MAQLQDGLQSLIVKAVNDAYSQAATTIDAKKKEIDALLMQFRKKRKVDEDGAAVPGAVSPVAAAEQPGSQQQRTQSQPEAPTLPEADARVEEIKRRLRSKPKSG